MVKYVFLRSTVLLGASLSIIVKLIIVEYALFLVRTLKNIWDRHCSSKNSKFNGNEGNERISINLNITVENIQQRVMKHR